MTLLLSDPAPIAVDATVRACVRVCSPSPNMSERERAEQR